MSRAASGDAVIVKPSNNIYTVLAFVGVVTVIFALVVVFMRAKELFPPDGILK